MKIIASVLLFAVSVLAKDCAVRSYGASSIVCVCNATYCDMMEPIAEASISGGQYMHVVSSKDGLRLKQSTEKFVQSAWSGSGQDPLRLNVRPDVVYQEIVGFGGAIADSSAINIRSLSDAAAENLMKSYFAEGGSQYTILRNPMGSTDFSNEYYTFDDVDGDTDLEHFALRDEDLKFKIPIIKWARELNKRGVQLFTGPWSAPYWMKQNSTVFGISHLRPENYQPWANYFVKYFDAYARENVTYWGVTAQNEPTQGDITQSPIISMGWTAEQQRDWVAQHLGPTLHRGGYDYLKLMILDDNRIHLPEWAETVFKDETASKYVSGTAVHFYTDNITSPDILNQTHNEFPDKFIFYTEACDLHQIVTSELGNWEIGEYYGRSIVQAVNNWAIGWTDWNLVLNLQGGPTWSPAPYNSAVIANATADEFYKQPMFYFIAHFASFVPPGSKHIGIDVHQQSNSVLSVAFLTPEQNIVIVLHNSNDDAESVVIADSTRGNIDVEIQGRSIHTLIYK